jgi:cell division protein FtsN
MASPGRGASRTNQVSRRRQTKSCVWWFLLGAMLGSFGVALYWMKEAPEAVPEPVAAIPKVERPAPPAPAYRFEDILRDAEVDTAAGTPPPPPAPRPEPIPEEELAPAAEGGEVASAAPAVATAPPAPAGSYLLQVGSYGTTQDAERVKAELALLGISTRIETVTVKGKVYHRVRTGPLDGKAAAEKMRTDLKRHGKDAMAVKVQ